MRIKSIIIQDFLFPRYSVAKFREISSIFLRIEAASMFYLKSEREGALAD